MSFFKTYSVLEWFKMQYDLNDQFVFSLQIKYQLWLIMEGIDIRIVQDIDSVTGTATVLLEHQFETSVEMQASVMTKAGWFLNNLPAEASLEEASVTLAGILQMCGKISEVSAKMIEFKDPNNTETFAVRELAPAPFFDQVHYSFSV